MTTAMPEGRFVSPGYGIPEAPVRPDYVPDRPYAATPAPYDPNSALSFIRSLFGDAFGSSAGDLAQELIDAYQRWKAGTPEQQVLEEIRDSQAYARRFGGIVELRKKGYRISEGEALDLERQYTQLGRQFDLPPGFVTQELMQRWIGGQASPVEIQRRFSVWQTWERETRSSRVDEEEINRQFAAAGLVPSDGDYLAAVMDGERSVALIEQRLNAGIVSGAAARSGYGALSIDQGLALADRGVTREQAEQGFGLLSDSTELFGAIAGEEGADTIGREEQIGAVFQGDSAARRRIERNRDRRNATFGGGGGASLGGGGLSGLGAG